MTLCNNLLIFTLVDTVTVTTSVDCGAYGYTTASYGPPTSASVPGTSGTETPPPATTGAETPTPAVPSSLSVTTTTTLTPETATTETPTAPPAVPGTTFVGSNTPVNTPPVFGSTGVNTLTTSGVTETTSSLTTETTGVTLSTTSARITPSTTTPPAPNNNAGATSGIHVGLLGLVAVLALA